MGVSFDTGISDYGFYVLYDYTNGKSLCYIIGYSSSSLIAESSSGAASGITVSKTAGGTVKITSNVDRVGGLIRLG